MAHDVQQVRVFDHPGEGRKRAKATKEAEAENRDEALHRIRKGAKRLRYTAAATGAKKVSDAAKEIQTLLGDHQDSVVSRTHLSSQADAACVRCESAGAARATMSRPSPRRRASCAESATAAGA